ncbi:DUF2147 domain-containing protein [Sphingomonas sabuli]|uniref:DUF2147 domain-containing protein n=1 Tax=Sphingomonas sabuli TaxID=2764186 RepID=A0A7G9KZX3_9SPHN|nr:DUF2147 domain-containing protein [Sphingomonas sabuli]QNM81922.1 DUF2147 domain-containing protein [Sphingomonas sabuli]
MKQMILSLAALGLLAGPAVASAKSPLEGRWRNGKMEVQIAPCGQNLCGTVVKASARQQARAERGSDTDLIGARLITGIHSTGSGNYKARVFVADQNIYASGTIRQVTSNQLKVKGCLMAVICKSKTWDRVR